MAALNRQKTSWPMMACGWVPVAFLSAIALWLSCAPSEQAKRPAPITARGDALTIFITGSELGALKPCGCSGGQLGGLDRRGSVFNTASKQARLIVDTGSLVKGEHEQDSVKFRILFEAFTLLDYDLVNLTGKDLEIASNLGLLDSLSLAFNAISSAVRPGSDLSPRFTKRILLSGTPCVVTIAAFDPKAATIESLAALFPSHPDAATINILIIDSTFDGIASAIARHAPSVDCVVCPSDTDEPRVIGSPSDGPLIFTVGRLGRRVCKLDVAGRPLTDGAPKDSLSFTRNGKHIRLTIVPVSEDLPQSPALVQLYKQYQQLVAEDGFLDRYPRVPLPNKLTYAGSESCRPCHEYEYDKWLEQTHAEAYATLVKVGSQFDPECVICHVVGMDYQEGFISEAKTLSLKDVGCESCHGPGSEHNKTLGKAGTVEPKLTCLDCHTPEHSTGYAGNEQLFMEKTVHWKELKFKSSVK